MTIIIAEAGVNHNGDENLALEMIDKAKISGADIIKFQIFKSNKLVTKSAKKANYQFERSKEDDCQLEMLKKLELSESSFLKLASYCKKEGVEFLSTAFDLDSLNFLVSELNQRILKIPSGEITNLPFILQHARTKLDIILSTGMANLSEIELALAVISFGFISDNKEPPSIEKFYKSYNSIEGQKKLSEKVTILHCTTEYPAPLNEINLRAMDTLKHSFKLRTGYSDHSEGIVIPIAAVAKGACVIEKHFTLDKKMKGPDHKASLEPEELTSMVKAIREVELSLGDGIKRPFPSEVKNKVAARKSLVASSIIKKNEVICENNIDVLRPGNGMSPVFYWETVGKKSSKNYSPGDLINE